MIKQSTVGIKNK